MGYLNFPPNLKDMFDDILTRLRKLETAQRFTAPNVATVPTNPRNGDIWLNTTSNAVNYIDGTGAVQTFTPPPYVAGKNAIINGGMDLWQRGTSFTSSGYTADRWYTSVAGTCTVSQITSNLPSNFQYGIQWVAGASNSYAQLIQAIEKANVIPLQGKTMTISGWVKVSTNFVGNWIFQNYYSTSTDTQAGDNVQNGSNVVIATNATTTWTRFSVTFTVPSTAVGLSMNFVPDNAAQVSTGTIQMTGVQLELGSTATTFSRAGGSIGGELALCQRYYYRTATGTTSQGIGQGFAKSTTVVLAQVQLPVTMRTNPSTTIDAANLAVFNGTSATITATVATVATSPNCVTVDCTGTGFTINTPYQLLTNTTAAYIGFSAEL